MEFAKIKFTPTQEQLLVGLLLLAAVGLSLYSHRIVLDEWLAPTFGNTGVHAASARHLVEHGEYPLNDYSYGGNVPNLYVPGYRLLLAAAVVVTGFSFDFAQRALVLLFAVLLPLGFFLLGRALFGTRAGVLAAFLSILPGELLVYTVRPLPQAMGMVLLPFAFWALVAHRRKLAVGLTLALAFTHQEAAVFFVMVAFAYAVAQAAARWWKTRSVHDVVRDSTVRLALLAWLVGVVAYLAWHFALVGNLNLWELSQFKYHEGGKLCEAAWEFFCPAVVSKTGLVVSALSVVGGLLLLQRVFRFVRKREWRADTPAFVFLAALVGVSLFAVKNDLVGIQVFMDRFLAYAQEALVVLAALAATALLAWLEDTGEKLSKRWSEKSVKRP